MNRRQFLGGFAAVIAALAASIAANRLGRPDREARESRRLLQVEAEISRIVRTRLDYLIIDEADLAAFAADYRGELLRRIRRQVRPSRRPVRWLHETSRLHLPWLAARDVRRACAEVELEDRVVVTMLGSTSFFYDGADESLPLTYRGLDAIHGTCRNPFARFS